MDHSGLGADPLGSTDPASWERLIASIHVPSLLVVIEARLGGLLRSRLTAEDVLQEALLHAWRDRATFEWRGPASFRGWLLRIIEHRINDAADREGALKRGGVELARSLDPAQPPPGMLHSTTPSRLAVNRELVEAMSAALASLPAGLAEVVRMRLFEQVPIDEIGRHLGIGRDAVRYRLRQGSLLYRRGLLARLASRSRDPGHTSRAGTA